MNMPAYFCFHLVAWGFCLMLGPSSSLAQPCPAAAPRFQPVPVADSAALAAALAAAVPGADIILGSGDYTADHGFTVAASGTGARPIVIRSAFPGKAIIGSMLTIAGQHVILRDLTFANAPLEIAGGADDGRIVRCVFRDSRTHGAVVLLNAQRWEIAYNEWVDFDRIGLSLRYDDATHNAGYAHIHHNYFHYTSGFKASARNGHEGLRLGEGVRDRPYSLHCLVEYNLFDGVNPPPPENETLSVKSCDNLIRFNTLLDCKLANNRFGVGNRWIGNWIEGGLGVNVRDGAPERPNLFVANVVKHCSQGFGLSSGTTDPLKMVGELPPGKPAMVAAVATVLIGNRTEGCNLILGQNARYLHSGAPAAYTRIEAHVFGPDSQREDQVFTDGSTPAQIKSVIVPVTRYAPIPPARRLAPDEVGLLAHSNG